MLKPLVPKFRQDLLTRLKYIAEKQVPAKLKPIVGTVMSIALHQASNTSAQMIFARLPNLHG